MVSDSDSNKGPRGVLVNYYKVHCY